MARKKFQLSATDYISLARFMETFALLSNHKAYKPDWSDERVAVEFNSRQGPDAKQASVSNVAHVRKQHYGFAIAQKTPGKVSEDLEVRELLATVPSFEDSATIDPATTLRRFRVAWNLWAERARKLGVVPLSEE